MEKEFVPYELALKLRELGFNEECLTKWGCTSLRFYENYKPCSNKDDIVLSGDVIAAPLWQQAFDYLLNRINDEFILEQSNDVFFISYEGLDLVREIIVKGDRKSCLEKLIEITKNKS